MNISTQLAPIVLFVYNRPWHTEQTLEALSRNELASQSVLYIYADGAKEDVDAIGLNNIKNTRDILRKKQWCKEVHIIENDVNKGLADSIVEGVTSIVNEYGKVIVLEDDIVSSSGFLNYMNDALDLYQNNDKVMHIGAFVPQTTGADQLRETFFLRFMSCWGWATWKRAWEKLIIDTDFLYTELPKRTDFSAFELDGALQHFDQIKANREGKIKTWAIKWYSSIFIEEGLCLYPRRSLVKNIGIDDSGENCVEGLSFLYGVDPIDSVSVSPIAVKESRIGKRYLRNFYLYGKDSSLIYRLKRRLLRNRLIYSFYKWFKK